MELRLNTDKRAAFLREQRGAPVARASRLSVTAPPEGQDGRGRPTPV